MALLSFAGFSLNLDASIICPVIILGLTFSSLKEPIFTLAVGSYYLIVEYLLVTFSAA